MAVAAHIVAIGDESAHHVGMQLKKAASEEERAFYLVFLQGGNDVVGAVGPLVGGEHQGYVFLVGVSLYYAPRLFIHVVALFRPVLRPALDVVSREGERERGRAVHRWLV